MDSRKKILLGSKDVVPQLNEDNYISVDLKRNYRELWPNRYYNDFNIFRQFQKERNSARNFVFYGIVDSIKERADNIAYTASFLNEEGAVVYQKTSTNPEDFESYRLSAEEFEGYKNIFGFERGQYKVELSEQEFNDHSGITSILLTFSGSQTPVNAFKRQFVYYDDVLNLDGNYEKQIIDYGTETIETNIDGSLVEIDNNFPFFYDTHWVKLNIDIKTELSLDASEIPYITLGVDAPGVLSTSFPSITDVNVNDVIYSLVTNNSYNLIVNLNGATAIGNEIVTVDVDIIDDTPSSSIHNTPFAPGTTFGEYPIVVQFNAGETERRISIDMLPNFGMAYEASFARLSIVSVENCLISPFNQNNNNVIREAQTPVITMIIDANYTEELNWRIHPIIKGETVNLALNISEPPLGDENISIFAFGLTETSTYDSSNSEFDGFNPYQVNWSIGESQQKFISYTVPIEFDSAEEVEYIILDLSGGTNCDLSTLNLAKRMVLQPRGKKIDLKFQDEITSQDGNEIYITKSAGTTVNLILTLELSPHGQEQVNLVNEGLSEDETPIPAFQFPYLNPQTVFWANEINAEIDIIIPYTVPGDADLLTAPPSPLSKVNFILEDFRGGTEIGDYNIGKTLSIRIA